MCRLYLHEAREQNGRWHLRQVAVHSGSGIFDMRWTPPLPGRSPMIALGLADGRVQLVRPPPSLSPNDFSAAAGAADDDLKGGRRAIMSTAAVKPSSAEDTTTGSCCSREGHAAVDEADGGSDVGWREAAAADVEQEMVLTVDWARHGSHRGRLVASTSTGHLATLQVNVLLPIPSFRSTQLPACFRSTSKHVTMFDPAQVILALKLHWRQVTRATGNEALALDVAKVSAPRCLKQLRCKAHAKAITWVHRPSPAPPVSKPMSEPIFVGQVAEAEMRVDHCWHGHDLEAWTIAADCHQVCWPPCTS